MTANGVANDAEGSVYCTGPCGDISEHADMAAAFAAECARRMVDAEEEGQRQANMGVRASQPSYVAISISLTEWCGYVLLRHGEAWIWPP